MTRFLELAAEVVQLPDDAFGWRILSEYGAIFVTTAVPPPVIAFESPADVDLFQARVGRDEANLDGISFGLQRPAMSALMDAVADASDRGLKLTPRGNDAGARSWGDSESLWRGRVARACTHWSGLGRVDGSLSDELAMMGAHDQARRVLALEDEGIYFSTYFDKSILHSVAAPGTSQHLSMLAFDVAEFPDPQIRSLLARHGWHQTVISDLPHFTFLGRQEHELAGLGLRRVTLEVDEEEYAFWVPGISRPVES